VSRRAEQTQGAGCARLTPGSGGIGPSAHLCGVFSDYSSSVTTESKGYDVARGSRLPGLFAPGAIR
jgi:hypothetical protein